MRKPRPIGTYRDANGQSHKLYRDDENYECIFIKGWPITVYGDGSRVDPATVLKEIEETKLGPFFEPYRR